MTRTSLERAIPAGDRILLDASALIAYFNAGEEVFPVSTYALDNLVKTGRNGAVVSMVTAMEVLIRPLRQGPGEPYRHVLYFLTRFPNLRPAVIDLVVAQEAASLRAVRRLSAPDALVIAT